MTEKDKLRDHQFDGIEEYDNALPRWWLGTFILTILIGLGYWFYYHVMQAGPNQETRFNQELAVFEQKQKASPQGAPVTDDELSALVKDPKVLASAKEIFQKNCVACHGNLAQGMIGPNLTDAYWLHGGKPTDIYRTISKGVPEKGMISWQGMLTANQIKSLVAFVLSVEGANPPGAKPPQGELVKKP